MDTLTQILLGAAVGQAVGGRRLGRLAPIAGAVGGLVPDLDVLWSGGGDSVAYWDLHRGITHSLFFGPVVGTALGYACARVHAKWAERRDKPIAGLAAAWIAVWVLALFTHPLLDLFTVYGTQLLAPFSDRRFFLPAVPIIDPVYTLMLVAGLVLAWRSGWRTLAAVRYAAGALLLSTAYLFVALAQNQKAVDLAWGDLAERGRVPASIHATTTMFTPWLRRIVVDDGEARSIGFVSTLNPQPIRWHEVPRDEAANALREAALATREGERYRRFATGPLHPHIVREPGGGAYLRIGDMRYGAPGQALTGLWGVSWPLDADGRIAGVGTRYRVSPEASRDRLVALFRASFGLPNEVF